MKIHLKSISLVSLRYLRNYCFLYFINSQKPCRFQESPLLSNLSYMYIKIERNEIAFGYSPQHCRCSFKQIWRHWPVKASHPGSHRPGRWARYPCSQTLHLDPVKQSQMKVDIRVWDYEHRSCWWSLSVRRYCDQHSMAHLSLKLQ